MTNQNYDPNQRGGFLVLWRKPGEKFYVFATDKTISGHYAEIKQEEIQAENHQEGKYWQGSRHVISAHKSLIVLRDEIIDGKGGLDAVIRQIKAGTFQLGKNGGEQQ